MDARFPPERRLRRRRDIDLVWRRGRRFAGRLLRVHARPNGLTLSRIAFSIPSRLCDAVERNRWKRLLRESFRLHAAEVGPGLDLVVVPLRGPGDLKRPDVDGPFLELVRRARAGLSGEARA
ncbi:MAG: ribonuclease P protein component [Planctomycetes bacterium]|nr:ribonuclease P protein component [Planctomycetota bacterium]